MKDAVSKSESVPYIAFESELARQERTIKRLWILCIVIFLAFVASNAAWIWYESTWEYYDTTTQEVAQDVQADGDAVVNGIGDINYGASETDN